MTLWRRRERARIRARGRVEAGGPRRRDAHGRPDRRELLPAAPPGLRPRSSSSTPARRPSGSSPRSRRAGAEVEAILLTHCHFDHIGAVAPVAAATGAPVYCPEIEVPILADIMAFVPWEGFGPYESYDADETVAGGETLELAGLELDVIFTPGHSPGHVTYSVRGEDAIFSGDVLFQGSVGRVDLPGGDGPTLMRLDRHPARHPPRRDRRPSRPHGDDDARRRARHQPVPRLAGAVGAAARSVRSPHHGEQVPGTARDLRRAARGRRARGRGSSAPRRRSSPAPATSRSRRRPSRTPSCSSAGSASRPTSSARRCSPSRTRASAASPCGRRGRRRSAAPTSSTGCTSWRSR